MTRNVAHGRCGIDLCFRARVRLHGLIIRAREENPQWKTREQKRKESGMKIRTNVNSLTRSKNQSISQRKACLHDPATITLRQTGTDTFFVKRCRSY